MDIAEQSPGGLAEGTILGESLRVGRLIGQGSSAEVYEATRGGRAGRYAVKVLRESALRSLEHRVRFRREAALTATLQHPHIVEVLAYDVSPDGRPYLLMERLVGEPLSAMLAREGRLPLGRVVPIVAQIASALTAAHRRGIVHRDLKPQNVFLVRPRGRRRALVKVMDFGTSKKVDDEGAPPLTRETTVIGTPQYMAPEQACGRLAEIDGRTDQFALAAITYEMLAGRPCFEAPCALAALYQIVHEAPPPLPPEVPRPVRAVVARGLAKRNRDRFPTLAAFHRALARNSAGALV